ncbi:MAG: N-acetylneuraminate synthase [Balneolaceae bacterium]|nr:N-acetylneuraminate synthase [Balneolaceae bacterium]
MDRAIIIAEAGVNHNGSMTLATGLIDAAAEAGADYVKFQSFNTEKMTAKDAPRAEYQKEEHDHPGGPSQYEFLKTVELTEAQHETLKKYAEKKEIKFLSTPFDLASADLLDRLGVDYLKIPSGEITNKPLIEHIASKGRDVILSTGMSTLEEVGDAIEILENGGIAREQLTVLHCTTEYPAPYDEVNLRAMETIREAFDVRVGYSDHTPGIEVPVAAVALGAVMVEKHFTLDRRLPGPDHRASLEPDELSEMVQAIRNVEKALGNPEKKPAQSEMKNRDVARKSIHLARDIAEGSVITENDLTMLRPGDGISPMEIEDIIGKKVVKNLQKGEKLKRSDLA